MGVKKVDLKLKILSLLVFKWWKHPSYFGKQCVCFFVFDLYTGRPIRLIRYIPDLVNIMCKSIEIIIFMSLRTVVLNRWVATHFWVAKTCVIILLYQYMGRQIEYYSVLWVANVENHCIRKWIIFLRLAVSLLICCLCLRPKHHI